MGEENLKNLDYFRFKIEKGWAKKNIPNTKEYRDRLEYEIQVISRMNCIDYMLMIADIVDFAKNNNIGYGFGRGSCGGSIIAYALGITGLDPIKFNLIFERFMNPARAERAIITTSEITEEYFVKNILPNEKSDINVGDISI